MLKNLIALSLLTSVAIAQTTPPTPVIASFTPASGPVGTVITITGTGFTGASAAFSGLQVYIPVGAFIKDGKLTVLNDTKAQYTVPVDAGTTNQLFVGNSAHAGWSGTAFTLVSTAAPPVPAGLNASAGNASVALTWTGVVGATKYNIKRASAAAGPFKTLSPATVAFYTDSTVANGATYFYVVSAVNAIGESPNSAAVGVVPAEPRRGAVTITVTPSGTHAISPYIYGVNYANELYQAGTASALPGNLTLDRAGGNRWTAYNWETNASNAGSDFNFQNDNKFPGSVPASAATEFIAFDQAKGMSSIITFQLQGLVAADESGPVSMASPPDLKRFKTVVFAKGSALTASPVTGDANVYMDEFAFAVDHKFAGHGIFSDAPTTKPVFASLDNEPDIWNATHKELGAAEPSAAAFIVKSIALATALKTAFPNMKIFGPANWGFYGMYSWQGAVTTATMGGANWFVDQYLAAIKRASAAYGRPLVDVYDFHWYTQITEPISGASISGLNGATLTEAQVQAIVQSPRSLWDPTYTEISWITKAVGAPLYIIPRMQAKIAAENPGMALAITEYYNGGASHIAGTIAQADNLGIYGAQNIFAANLWPLATTEPYVLAGFRAFRNFDGAGGNFGDISVAATSSAIAEVSAYVSTDSTKPGRVVIVLINRSPAVQTTTVSGQPLSGTAHIYQISAAKDATPSRPITPKASGTQTVAGSSMSITLPPYSVTTADIF